MVKAHSPIQNPDTSRRMNRLSVSAFFALHGLAFATWASRIPTIQSSLKLGAAELGLLLFMLPLGFFISLPFAGWLNAKVGSRRATILSAILYSTSLALIGISTSSTQVAIGLFLFGFFANILNISMNTQAVEVEKLYDRKLMATFHGLWSLAGFAGAGIGAWMTSESIAPGQHFILIAIIFLVGISIASFALVPVDKIKGESQPLFAMPNKPMFVLGTIAFCSTIVEGAMFDWSGIYFTDVVKVSSETAGLGYTTFMVAMASMRFLADRVAGRFGLKRILQLSGILSATGLLIAVVLPTLGFAVFAFFLVGMGVSSVAPMVYSAAGRSKTMTASSAITAVSSLGFVGFLIGPPVIGFIAGASSLVVSFLALTVMATLVTTLSSFIRESR